MYCPSCRSENPATADTCSVCGAPFSPLAPGSVVAGRYEVLVRLGKGGMGVVYKAKDRLLNETVAIKILRPDTAGTKEAAQRFLSEIKLARAVSHRNVCRIHEYGEEDGLKYISMAYVDGVDLKTVLRQRGALPPDEAYELSLQIAEGLAAIHAEGIIHRDLKTANIMLDAARQQVRLMDFGIAKLWSDDESAAGMTGTGQIVGSPDYMSPEQIQAKKLDFRSDVYSLGIVVYEIFSGKVPFHADTPVAILMGHLQEPPLLEGSGAPLLPQALVPVLRKALEKDPARRFASVEEMRHALVTARETRRTAVRSTDVPNLPSTMQVRGGPSADDPLPSPGSTESLTAPPLRTTEPMERPSPRPVRRATPAMRPRPQPTPRAPLALAASLVIAGAAILFGVTRLRQPSTAPPPSLAPATTVPVDSAPVTVPAAEPTPEVLRPTSTLAAAAPTTHPSLQRAQAALVQGRYDEALAAAQEVLSSQPANAAARSLVASARQGQKAEGHFQAAEAALSRADLTEAMGQVESGRVAAPNDPRAAALVARIATAERQRREETGTRVQGLLQSAEKALDAQDYDGALRAYDEAIKLEPQNQIAVMGRATAVNARVTARASGAAKPAPGRRLVAGVTTASSAETRAAEASVPPGFKDTPGIAVTRDTQAADLPGQIRFETDPEAIAPGDSYTIRVLFANAGSAPIEIAELVITTIINGRRTIGAVPPQTRSVGPKQQALLRQMSDMWRGDVKSWSMEVAVKTARGESYRNELVSR